MILSKFNDSEAMFEVMSALFAEEAGRAVESRGEFVVAFSGGSSPLGLFDVLSGGGVEVDWDRTVVFQVDERAVPPDHAWSNFKALDERLLSKVPVRLENVHRIKGELSPAEAADEYEGVLRGFRAERPASAPLFDLVLLGMGSDGHTASIFPGSASEKETGRLAVAVPAPASVAPRVPRVTLTYPALNDSWKALFLTSGKERLEMALAILDNREEGRGLPPAGIEPRGDVEWFVAI